MNRRSRRRLARRHRSPLPRFRVGVVDTTFARVDMGSIAVEEIEKLAGNRIRIERTTVPGVKDLAAAVRLFFDRGADLVVACGWIGPAPIDKTCGHEASLGLMWIRATLGKPILEVFVHADEVRSEEELKKLAEQRTREHAENAVKMLLDPGWLVENAGKGLRQGFEDEGPIA